MKNFETTDQLITFLTDALIPDLRESGTDATADDFQECVDTILTLENKVRILGRRLEARIS